MALSLLELLPLLILPCLPQGDKDLRDIVKTKDGKEVRGRVLRLYDDKEIVLIQGVKPVAGGAAGGKRIRIPREKVVSVETVNANLRKFLDKHAAAKRDEDALWKLVEWANKKGLLAMARLQALQLVLRNDDHRGAHKYLGHRKTRRGWKWKRKNSLLSRKKYEEKIAKWGSALILPTEHFELRTDAGLKLAVDVALDLEKVYLHWFQLFGKQMRLQEAVSPMAVHLYRDVKRFPVWTFRVQLAYYTPPQGGDYVNAFVAPETGEPEQLITVVTQQLIYRTVRATGMGNADPRQHVSGWLEYGVGQWMESMFEGKYGRLKLRRPTLDPRQTVVLSRMGKLELKHFLHASYSQYLDYTKRTKERWALSSHLVHYLMEKDHGHRADFLEYIHEVFHGGKGDSSTAFAKFLKVPMKDLESLFQGWLLRQTG
ncbi:MAG: hypothetical protein ACYTGW_21760, partial [Planctomycetota bacterium]